MLEDAFVVSTSKYVNTKTLLRQPHLFEILVLGDLAIVNMHVTYMTMTIDSKEFPITRLLGNILSVPKHLHLIAL